MPKGRTRYAVVYKIDGTVTKLVDVGIYNHFFILYEQLEDFHLKPRKFKRGENVVKTDNLVLVRFNDSRSLFTICTDFLRKSKLPSPEIISDPFGDAEDIEFKLWHEQRVRKAFQKYFIK